MKFDGNKLRELRKGQKLTQTALGVGICSASYISMFETSKMVPAADVVHKLAERLGVAAETLYVSEVAPVVVIDQQSETKHDPQVDGPSEVPKPLQYMNRAEKNNWMFVNGFIHKLEHIIDEFKTHGRDEQMIEMLVAGQKMIAKAMAWRLLQMEPKSIVGLNRETYMLDVALVHKSDALRHFKKFYAEDREMRRQAAEELGGDPISDLAELTMVSFCHTCDGEPCRSKNGCSVFQALTALNVPAWDDEHPKCVYAGAGLLEVAMKAGA